MRYLRALAAPKSSWLRSSLSVSHRWKSGDTLRSAKLRMAIDTCMVTRLFLHMSSILARKSATRSSSSSSGVSICIFFFWY